MFICIENWVKHHALGITFIIAWLGFVGSFFFPYGRFASFSSGSPFAGVAIITGVSLLLGAFIGEFLEREKKMSTANMFVFVLGGVTCFIVLFFTAMTMMTNAHIYFAPFAQLLGYAVGAHRLYRCRKPVLAFFRQH